MKLLVILNLLLFSSLAFGKVNLGTSYCTDAINEFLLKTYPCDFQTRHKINQEIDRLIDRYLAPTDWQSALGIDSVLDYQGRKDKRYFTNTIFDFGSTSSAGPIFKDAFSMLPGFNATDDDLQSFNELFFNYVNFKNFNDYRYFFCNRQRIHATLDKYYAENLTEETIHQRFANNHIKILNIKTMPDGQVFILGQKQGKYYFMKINGAEIFMLHFSPDFAKQFISKR